MSEQPDPWATIVETFVANVTCCDKSVSRRNAERLVDTARAEVELRHAEALADLKATHEAAMASAGQALESAGHALREENARLRTGLERLRDCDFVITPADRMDAVRDIARDALQQSISNHPSAVEARIDAVLSSPANQPTPTARSPKHLRADERTAVVDRLRAIVRQVDEVLGQDTLIALSCHQMIAGLQHQPSADTIASVRALYRDGPAAMAAALLNMRAENARRRAGLERLVAAVERDDNCIDQGHFSGSEEMRAARAALAQ